MRYTILILGVSLAIPACFGAQASFDPNQKIWTLSNGSTQAVFQLTSEDFFRMQSLADSTLGDEWDASLAQPSSPIHLVAGTDVFDTNRRFALNDQYTETLTSPTGVRQYIVLDDFNRAGQITVVLEIYDNEPVLRYRVWYRNQTPAPVYLTSVDMAPWAFSAAGQRYTAFRVNQWSVGAVPANFEQTASVLDSGGMPFSVYSGAHATNCGWLAIRDGSMRGLFAGWEFDGRATSTVAQFGTQDYLQFSSTVQQLNHLVQPMEVFQAPYAFIGLFHGDFDEAGFRTQQFSEAVLAKPAPDAAAFPYVAWDSWGYGGAVDENTLRQNAAIAASVGAELFIVDLGWAQRIGDWYADPSRFPSGLGALADYVHSLGMKFGLHWALTEADPASAVLQANPDWTSTENDQYHGAVSLCLANQPTQDWLVAQGLHIIDDYHVDWILQDGENMVKTCTKTTHTHDANDSNYSNSVNGIDAVVERLQALRPNVSWENCEDGGNMMTFEMVHNYVTSITNDASGSFASRQAAYGATYPFSPRYAERYMPQSDSLDTYTTSSYRFGGNWVLMNQLASLNPVQLALLRQEIQSYKAQRSIITGGKVYHLLAPSTNGVDVIQTYNAALDSALAVVTRESTQSPQYTFKPVGLNPAQRYAVWFDFNPAVYFVPGWELMASGVVVTLPTPQSSDVVHIEHQ
jgi:alpha-galactosidase